MRLEEILLLPDVLGKDEQAVVDYGNEKDVVISTDLTAYTWSGIGQKLILAGLSPDVWMQFNAGISSIPGGPALYNCLVSGGFNFGDPPNRQLIKGMEIKEPDWAVAVLEAMLAIGEVTGTRWQLWGVDPENPPKADDFKVAQSSNARDEWVAQVKFEVLQQNKSIDELKADIAALV